MGLPSQIDSINQNITVSAEGTGEATFKVRRIIGWYALGKKESWDVLTNKSQVKINNE